MGSKSPSHLGLPLNEYCPSAGERHTHLNPLSVPHSREPEGISLYRSHWQRLPLPSFAPFRAVNRERLRGFCCLLHSLIQIQLLLALNKPKGNTWDLENVPLFLQSLTSTSIILINRQRKSTLRFKVKWGPALNFLGCVQPRGSKSKVQC